MSEPGAPARTEEAHFESIRTGLSVDSFKRAFLENLFYARGRAPAFATRNDCYMALAYTVRDRLLDRWINNVQTYVEQEVRAVCYLSAEFLMGPHLANNLLILGIAETARQALAELKLDLDELLAQEEEPGLGNGGLGRLAACFLDSLATLGIPAVGYGIRYEFGIFDQEIRDGWQVEIADKWLRLGNPWEIKRPENAVRVRFGGRTEAYTDPDGRYRVRWLPGSEVLGVPYDTPVLGYGTNAAATLRLWSAEAPESFNLDAFSVGDYLGAVREKIVSETISKILYPRDDRQVGKELRLEQQYFFVACSLQDLLRLFVRKNRPLEELHQVVAIQLNDTHPALAVAELMRLLVDEHDLEWERAWEVTRAAISYTNHTLLPEALERWPLGLFGGLLPRHLEIIYEINRRFLDEVRVRFPNDDGRLARLSLIDESGERFVRMAHLAVVGSHAINGVAALHSELLARGVMRDFHELWPEKFFNVTNGVTPRRWMALSNPPLAALITRKIGPEWIRNLSELRRLEAFAADAGFRREWRQCKQEMKTALAAYIREKLGLEVRPDTLFDVQVKRIHEYKRQHLNVLHILTLYYRIKKNPGAKVTPRTFIFGGKAAPGYFMAKLIIKLVHAVGEVVNNDPDVAGRLKVVFLPDYNVTLGQRVYPAADLSEQISTAGKEASGTGNMKFAMNGALTIGTLDGANIEIRDEVGEDNFFLFGLTAGEVAAYKAGGYNPREYYEYNPQLREIFDGITSGAFSRGDAGLFRPLVDSLLYTDEYLLLADYQSYVDCHDRVGRAYENPEQWTRMSILNVARIGKFSSDRSIQEYCDKIWHVGPLNIELHHYLDDIAAS